MRFLTRFLRPECHQVRQVLQSFVDGELGEDDAAMVAGHLVHCDRCGIEAELYEQVKQSLALLRQPPDPAAVERLRRFAQDVPDLGPPPDESPAADG